MLTAFVKKILVLGTNRTKLAAGRSMGNHSNKGQQFCFLLLSRKAQTVAAERLLLTRAEGPKLHVNYCRPPSQTNISVSKPNKNYFVLPSRIFLLLGS